MCFKSNFKLLLYLGFIFLFFFPAGAEDLKNKEKVLFFVSQTDFRDEEYLKSKKILMKAGYDVVTISNTKEQASGMLGAKIMPNMALSAVKTSAGYAAFVIVGGSGAIKYEWENRDLIALIRDFYQNSKIIAAISRAPVVVAQAKVLEKKLATVANIKEAKQEFKKYKVKYISKDIVIAGNIVTADGPQTAHVFGKTIMKLLLKGEKK